MARASTLTKLSLDRFAAIMGFHPAHFNGVFFGNFPTICQSPWLQHAWQAVDRVGREEVAMAIAQAEADIESFLGFRLMPSWEVDERHGTIFPYRPELVNLTGTDIRGYAQSLESNFGYIIAGGIKAKSLIAASLAVGYADNDGDTYKETATATIATTVAPCEIHVYYPGHAGEDEWEIRPISVSVAAGIATLTFRREQCVLSSLYDDLFADPNDSHLRGVDGAVDANFLATIDVYRVYNDPQTQVSFLWEPLGTGNCSCNGSGCGTCAYAAQTGCLTIRGEPRQGVLGYRPADWSAVAGEFTSAAWALSRQPDVVRLYYYGGWQKTSLTCPLIQMDPEWERVIAYCAASLLDRPACECNNVHAWIEHWRYDFATAPPDEAASQVPPSALDNPLGTKRGQLFAWKRVLREGAARGRLIHA